MKRCLVLFVDDEPGLVSAVVRRLGLRGIDAHGVTSGIDALKEIENNRFDVAVIDVRMPDIGGLELANRLRMRHPHLAVVLMSGHGSVESKEEGEQLGAFAYLQKPVEIDDLVAVIRDAAEQHGGAGDV